jgi:predicted transcriptional regulator
MEVIRVVKDKNYTTINNTIFKDRKISCKSKGVFATIMSLPDNWDFSISGLSSILKEGKSAIYSAIEELENNGYVQRKRVRNKEGKISGTSYKFFETPINTDLNPHPENPYVDNPDMDNQPQLNTNIINNLNNKNTHSGLSDTPIDSVVSKDKNQSIDFDGLLKLFNAITNKKFRVINKKARKQFLEIIKANYTKEDIRNAIINCFNSDYHKQNPHYLTPEFISRMDKFEKYVFAKPKKEVLPKDWFSRELTDDQKELVRQVRGADSLKRWEDNRSAIMLEGGRLYPVKIEYKQ